MIKGIKNRAPAPIQITAEQLLREAQERGFEDVPTPPEQLIADRDELLSYQQGKRKDFEDQLRRKRQNIGIWCKYALWEASQNEFERARSVFERALDVDYRNLTLWLKYAEMEMKHKFLNHARNIWDRAVTLLPRQGTLDFICMVYVYGSCACMFMRYFAACKNAALRVTDACTLYTHANTIPYPYTYTYTITYTCQHTLNRQHVVQVHVHGGDGGCDRECQGSLREVDGVGAR